MFDPFMNDKIRTNMKSNHPNSNSLIVLSQRSSQLVVTITLYSVSTLDFITTLCFLLFHEIKLSHIETRYSKVDLLLEGDPAQSVFE